MQKVGGLKWIAAISKSSIAKCGNYTTLGVYSWHTWVDGISIMIRNNRKVNQQ